MLVTSMGDKYIKWLSDLSKEDIKLAGGKGANLGEMFNAKFPVPPAFVATTDAFFHFLKETKLEQPIKDILNTIDVDETQDLTKKAQEIRDLITEAEIPEKLKEKSPKHTTTSTLISTKSKTPQAHSQS